MGLPLVMWGDEGEQFNLYSSKRYALGQKMIFLDGRAFRFCSAAVPFPTTGGQLISGAPTVANHVNLAVQAATALGATAIPVTIGATTVTANQYQDGYIAIDVTPGQGFIYNVGPHASNGITATTFSVPLKAGDGVTSVALTTSSKATLIQNPYANVQVHPGFPANITAPVLGVACSVPTATNNFFWIQTFGTASVLTSGVVVVGMGVAPSVLVSGAVDAWSCVAAAQLPIIGQVTRVGATTAQSECFIRLDG